MVELPIVGDAQRTIGNVQSARANVENPQLRELAEKFETAFLSEMLRHAGLGEMSEGLNGGAGEARFSGFLIEAYAQEISKTGQFGLADQIYRDLVARGIDQ